LTEEDYSLLRTYMRMPATESTDPVYPKPAYWPAYVKFLMFGSDPKAVIPPNLRMYNKVGDAYGFLIDGAYIHDTATGVEFLLSARLYCNSDGVLNDDHYDYDSVGFPFLKKLGEAVYAFELEKMKKRQGLPAQ